MRFGKTTALVFGTAVLTISGMGSASAAEFGTGPWVRGYTDIFGGVLPSQPGWYSRTDIYHYNGSAVTTIFNGRIAIGVDEDYTATLFALNYVTPWKILGGTYAVAVVPSAVAMEWTSAFNNSADPTINKALATAPEESQALMRWKMSTLARVVNSWSMNTDTMGVYGNYYLKRAIVAQQGLGANLPEDAIYPLNLGDSEGKPLDGANDYTIHFDRDQIPPAQAFWSITLYDDGGFQVANPLNRFAVSSWMPTQVQPRRFARSLFSKRKSRRRQRSELAARSQRTVQPDHEALCPEVERADRQVEPAADYKGCRRNDVAAIKRNWLIGQGLALAQMWL